MYWVAGEGVRTLSDRACIERERSMRWWLRAMAIRNPRRSVWPRRARLDGAVTVSRAPSAANRQARVQPPRAKAQFRRSCSGELTELAAHTCGLALCTVVAFL